MNSFTNLSSKEFARQLTLFEWKLFRDTEIASFKTGMENCAHLLKFTSWFNGLCSFIVTDILRPELEARIDTLKWWIKVCGHCQKLRNFNGMMEILSALGSCSLTRLRKSWDALPSKYLKKYADYEERMSSLENFKNYRQSLHSEKKPVIPYLGIHLRDLIFLEENSNTLQNGNVNTFKLEHLDKVITLVTTFQGRPFKINLDNDVQLQLEAILKLESMWPSNDAFEECWYTLSKELEPCGGSLLRKNSWKEFKEFIMRKKEEKNDVNNCTTNKI